VTESDTTEINRTEFTALNPKARAERGTKYLGRVVIAEVPTKTSQMFTRVTHKCERASSEGALKRKSYSSTTRNNDNW
jgi:hypothetical protein